MPPLSQFTTLDLLLAFSGIELFDFFRDEWYSLTIHHELPQPFPPTEWLVAPPESATEYQLIFTGAGTHGVLGGEFTSSKVQPFEFEN